MTFIAHAPTKQIPMSIRFDSILGHQVFQVNYKDLDPEASSKREVIDKLRALHDVRQEVGETIIQSQAWQAGIIQLSNDSEHDYILLSNENVDLMLARYLTGTTDLDNTWLQGEEPAKRTENLDEDLDYIELMLGKYGLDGQYSAHEFEVYEKEGAGWRGGAPLYQQVPEGMWLYDAGECECCDSDKEDVAESREEAFQLAASGIGYYNEYDRPRYRQTK